MERKDLSLEVPYVVRDLQELEEVQDGVPSTNAAYGERPRGYIVQYRRWLDKKT